MNKKTFHKLVQKIIRHIFWTVPDHHKVIYLTFDDGPHPEYTVQILDILKRYNVTATFFVVGQQVKNYPEILKRISSEGHSIGVHGYTHVHPKSLGIRSYIREYDRAKEVVNDLILNDLSPVIVRPPYGHIDLISTVLLLFKKYRVAMWSIDSLDWDSKSPDDIIEKILGSGLCGGDILLFHDDCLHTVPALSIIIEKLTLDGYVFGKIR